VFVLSTEQNWHALLAHCTLLLARPTDNMPLTRYVKGESRYMKIQKRGKLDGCASTPQKIRHSVNMRLAMLPPVSADSTPAMTMCVKVDVKIRNIQTKRKSWNPRSATASVASALRYRPMG
jgi:hypothetical protein